LESTRISIKSPIFSKNFATFVIAIQLNMGLMEKRTRARLIFTCLTLDRTRVDKSFHKDCLHTQINSFCIWSMFLLSLSLLFLVNFCPNPSNINGVVKPSL
jgi:hypothetical protein